MPTGIGIQNPVFFIGVVENNLDPTFEGRVQVRAFSVHGTNKEIPTESLPWAVCASGNYELIHTIPSLNSFVYGMFLDGVDAQQPMILGAIPTQMAEKVDPSKNGWGVFPSENGEELSKASGPRDFGQPTMSRLARGESIEESYVLYQEMSRCEDMKIGGTDEKWSEPPSAYSAQYPFNRVIETVHHSIELDDTPDGERIMIRHKEGSFIQIDSVGATTHKSAGDKYDINCGNAHEFVEHNHYVTIGGNAHVYVKGNKTEEIEGDYRLLVHGHAELASGGQMSLNAGEQLQGRAADVKFHAHVGTMSLRAERELQMGADPVFGDVTVSAARIYNTGYLSHETYTTGSYKVTSIVDTHFVGSNLYINMNGVLPPLTPLPPQTVLSPTAIPFNTIPGIHILSGTTTNIKTGGALTMDTIGATIINSGAATTLKAGGIMDIGVGGIMTINSAAAMFLTAGGTAMINAPLVAIDDVVTLGTGVAIATPITPPVIVPPQIGIFTLPGWPTSGISNLPEPPSKSMSLQTYTPSGSGSGAGVFIAPSEEE